MNHRIYPSRTGTGSLALLLSLAAGTFLPGSVLAIPASINLGAAGDFAVLAGAGITIIGPTTITGDIGTFPTPSITITGGLTLNGVNHADDIVTQLAKGDLTRAYNLAAGLSYDVTYSGGFDLVGLTLPSGVYNGSSSLFVSGSLVLDGQGNPNAVWVFQTGSTLISASDTVISLINGAQAGHVFWQVGSSATLGTDTVFVGNIMALNSITLHTGTAVDGSLLARCGAITLDNNRITQSIYIDAANVPETGTNLAILALGAGLAGFVVMRRRAACRVHNPGCSA